MALYKRGSVWWMSFQFNNRYIQKTTKCKNKRDAADVERAYRTQLAKGEVGFEAKKEIPAFAEAIKSFLEWSKVEHAAKPNTRIFFESASKSLIKFFKDTPLDLIKPEDVERFKTWRKSTRRRSQKKKQSKQTTTQPFIRPATINREMSVLRILFNRHIKNNLLVKNPVSGVKFLKEENEQMRVVSEDEEKLYLMAASQPLRDIASLMIETGMRPEEIFRIERKNVHLDRGYIFNPFGKTEAAKRKIPLTQRASAIVERRLKEEENSFIFASEKTGKPLITLKTAHRGALKRSGVEQFRIYDLRHTFATRAAEAGVDLMTLKSLLGHTKIQMVTRYPHPTEKHQFDAIKKMEAVRLEKEAQKQQKRG